MHYGVYIKPFKRFRQSVVVPQIPLDEVLTQYHLSVSFGQIVIDHDLISFFLQSLRAMTANIAGPACD
jgi:hypothetical protein